MVTSAVHNLYAKIAKAGCLPVFTISISPTVPVFTDPSVASASTSKSSLFTVAE